jgi:hypothetical protein
MGAPRASQGLFEIFGQTDAIASEKLLNWLMKDTDNYRSATKNIRGIRGEDKRYDRFCPTFAGFLARVADVIG